MGAWWRILIRRTGGMRNTQRQAFIFRNYGYRRLQQALRNTRVGLTQQNWSLDRNQIFLLAEMSLRLNICQYTYIQIRVFKQKMIALSMDLLADMLRLGLATYDYKKDSVTEVLSVCHMVLIPTTLNVVNHYRHHFKHNFPLRNIVR